MAHFNPTRSRVFLLMLLCAVLAMLSGPVQADPITFDVTFYGDSTDEIKATGVVVIDDSHLVGGTVSFGPDDYSAGLVDTEITISGNVYTTNLALGYYIPIVDDGVVTVGPTGLRELTWTAAMNAFPILTPDKPVLPPPQAGNRDPNDGGGGSGDYILGQDSDNLPMSIYMFSNGWVMSKGPWDMFGSSSSFVERIPVPEPATMLILAAGMAGVSRRRRRNGI